MADLASPESSGLYSAFVLHCFSSKALPPVVELTCSDAQPVNESSSADLGLLRPAPDEIHDLIPRIVRNPDPGQSSPSVFFSATCSAILTDERFLHFQLRRDSSGIDGALVRPKVASGDFGYSGFMKPRISAIKAPARSLLKSKPKTSTLIAEAPIVSALAMSRNTEWNVLASKTEIRKRKRPRPLSPGRSVDQPSPESCSTTTLQCVHPRGEWL